MKIPIYLKITLIFGAIIALILVGIYSYLNISLRENTYQRIRINLMKQAALSRFLLEENQASNGQWDALATKIGEDLGVRATIIALDGVVLGDSEIETSNVPDMENHIDRPEIQEALKSGMGESKRFSNTVKKEMFYLAITYGKDRPKGVIRLSMPLVEI